MVNKKLVREALLYLSEIGWSDLIDERWKEDVQKEIKTKFTNIDTDTLNSILETVIY